MQGTLIPVPSACTFLKLPLEPPLQFSEPRLLRQDDSHAERPLCSVALDETSVLDERTV
ncbi:MAG: hypothetical protein ACXWFU_11400 [Actinomycetota bacterium]